MSDIIERVEAIREEDKRIRRDASRKMLELEAERDMKFALKQNEYWNKVFDKIFKLQL